MQLDADAGAIAGGQHIRVELDASDPDGDPLTVQWEVVSESTVLSAGGDHEDAIVPVPVKITDQETLSCTITMPSKAGAYRIFATIRDGHGHAGTANLPVLIVE